MDLRLGPPKGSAGAACATELSYAGHAEQAKPLLCFFESHRFVVSLGFVEHGQECMILTECNEMIVNDNRLLYGR